MNCAIAGAGKAAAQGCGRGPNTPQCNRRSGMTCDGISGHHTGHSARGSAAACPVYDSAFEQLFSRPGGTSRGGTVSLCSLLPFGSSKLLNWPQSIAINAITNNRLGSNTNGEGRRPLGAMAMGRRQGFHPARSKARAGGPQAHGQAHAFVVPHSCQL